MEAVGQSNTTKLPPRRLPRAGYRQRLWLKTKFPPYGFLDCENWTKRKSPDCFCHPLAFDTITASAIEFNLVCGLSAREVRTTGAVAPITIPASGV